MTIQPQNNNLNYLIAPTSTNFKRLSLLFQEVIHVIIEPVFHIIMYLILK